MQVHVGQNLIRLPIEGKLECCMEMVMFGNRDQKQIYLELAYYGGTWVCNCWSVFKETNANKYAENWNVAGSKGVYEIISPLTLS